MLDNHQWRKEMENLDEFNKKRKRGLWILLVNEGLALASLYYYKIGGADWIFYSCLIYFVISSLLLTNRIFKVKPKDESNYLFGEKMGDKMNKTPQKFIYEAMMVSLVFIIITDLFSMIWAIGFTDIGLVYKIIAGVSGFFGAIFMLMILISTFQQYKQLTGALKFQEEIMKGGIKEWLNKK